MDSKGDITQLSRRKESMYQAMKHINAEPTTSSNDRSNPRLDDIKSKLSQLYYPLSALSTLPYKLPPSLLANHPCPHPRSTTSTSKLTPATKITLYNPGELQRILLTEPEDDTRRYLSTLLKQLIVQCKGTLPPEKKRGFGAEILALIQALLTTPYVPVAITAHPHSDASKNVVFIKSVIKRLGYNPYICEEYMSLIRLCYAVIDTMQRSSEKQYAAVCDWEASYDTRSAREEVVTKLLLAGREGAVDGAVDDGSLKYAVKQSLMHISSMLNTAKSPLQSSKQSDKAASSSIPGTIPDLTHVLMELLGVLSLVGGDRVDEGEVKRVFSDIAVYIKQVR